MAHRPAGCILLGLQHLQRKNIVHQDVRWDNVVRLGSDIDVLIDLEMANEADLACAWPYLATWVEGKALEGDIYTVRSDLYLFGRMMSQFNLSPAGRDLQVKLLGKGLPRPPMRWAISG